VWLWAIELHELGFRRKSDRYWQCERRYGLPAEAHLSVFAWGEHGVAADAGAAPRLVEVSTFHVTFEIGRENIHFYYHELSDNEWEPAGHTSAAEIARLGRAARELRRAADEIAAALVAALGGTLHPREPETG
jgi:hypothetical protein